MTIIKRILGIILMAVTVVIAVGCLLFVLFLLDGAGADIVEVRNITDLSQPQYVYYDVQRNPSKVHYKIKGTMNGSLGVIGGNCIDRERFSSFIRSKKLSGIDRNKRTYVKVYSDSVRQEGGAEYYQSRQMYCLGFIPGTATKGKIEVEFRKER